jgi:hypothetical protein
MTAYGLKAGPPDDIIVSRIRSEARLLKSAGVSDGVLRALVSPPPVLIRSGMTLTVTRGQDVPISPHDPIYIVKDTGEDGRTLVLMERAAAGHEKTTNFWAYMFLTALQR